MLEARPAKQDSSTQRHIRTLPCFTMASGIFQLPIVVGLAQWCPHTIHKIDPEMPGQFNDKAGEHLCNFYKRMRTRPPFILWYPRMQQLILECQMVGYCGVMVGSQYGSCKFKCMWRRCGCVINTCLVRGECVINVRLMHD